MLRLVSSKNKNCLGAITNVRIGGSGVSTRNAQWQGQQSWQDVTFGRTELCTYF